VDRLSIHDDLVRSRQAPCRRAEADFWPAAQVCVRRHILLQLQAAAPESRHGSVPLCAELLVRLRAGDLANSEHQRRLGIYDSVGRHSLLRRTDAGEQWHPGRISRANLRRSEAATAIRRGPAADGEHAAASPARAGSWRPRGPGLGGHGALTASGARAPR